MSAIDDRTTAWVREQLADVPRPIVRFGSQAWWHQPDRRLQWMSILVAAESWRTDSLPAAIALRFTAELQVRRAEEDEHFAALHAEAQRVVRSIARQPGIGLTYEERRARELAAAIEGRPGDFPGRGHLQVVKGGRS